MWEQIALWVATLVISYALRPKPPGIGKPATLAEIAVPTADEGREIPVLFGTMRVRGPVVCWYGDLKTKAIKKSGGKK